MTVIHSKDSCVCVALSYLGTTSLSDHTDPSWLDDGWFKWQ